MARQPAASDAAEQPAERKYSNDYVKFRHTGEGGDDKFYWPDLSAYGLKVIVAVLPTNKTLLLVKNGEGQDLRENAAPIKQALMNVGFEEHKTGMWLKYSTLMDIKPYVRELPKTKVVETTRKEVCVWAPEPAPAPAAR